MPRGLGLGALGLVVLTLGATAAAAAPAPPIAGKTLAGKQVSLRDLRGKPVVINVWSSW